MGRNLSPADTSVHRNPWRDPWVWCIAGAALCLRLVYLWDLRATPFYLFPQMDALYHHQWALQLAAGDWIGSEVFFRAPLYPYFLGLLYSLGLDTTTVRLVQFGIASLTVLLVQRFVYPRWGRGAALVSGALTALYGPLVYFEGELLLVVLEAMLFLVVVWTLQRAWEVPERGTRWLAAGCSLGAAALVRPIVLPLFPVAAAALLFRLRGGGWRPAIAYGVGTVLVLSPVLMRNALVGGDVVPVASQGGWNFYLGNHEGADGRAALKSGFSATWAGGLEDARSEAERAAGRPLKPSQVSRYWYGRALEWAGTNPGRFVAHQIRKFGYFWDGFELPNNQNYYYFSGLARLFQVPLLLGFGVIGPAALAGLVFAWGGRRLTFPVAAVPATLIAVIVAFFVCGRFRAPLAPLLSIWAGVGLLTLPRLVSMRKLKALGAGTLVLLFSAWFVNGDVHGFRERSTYSESHLRLGVFYETQGDPKRALSHYRSATETNPGFVEGWNNMGSLLAKQNDFSEAEEAWLTALQLEPDHPKALSNMAALEYRRGNAEAAVTHALRILNTSTRDSDALMNAGVVLGNLGNYGGAQRCFERLAGLQPWNAHAVMGLARAWISLGYPDRASKVLYELPEDRRTVEVLHLMRSLED